MKKLLVVLLFLGVGTLEPAFAQTKCDALSEKVMSLRRQALVQGMNEDLARQSNDRQSICRISQNIKSIYENEARITTDAGCPNINSDFAKQKITEYKSNIVKYCK